MQRVANPVSQIGYQKGHFCVHLLVFFMIYVIVVAQAVERTLGYHLVQFFHNGLIAAQNSILLIGFLTKRLHGFQGVQQMIGVITGIGHVFIGGITMYHFGIRIPFCLYGKRHGKKNSGA